MPPDAAWHLHIGISGYGEMTVTNDASVNFSRELVMGTSTTGVGRLVVGSGTFRITRESYIGRSGSAEIDFLTDVSLVRGFVLGENATGRGILRAGAHKIDCPDGSNPDNPSTTIGGAGHGELHLSGTAITFFRRVFLVRSSATGFCLVRGRGTITWTDVNQRVINNGLIVADGSGTASDLAFAGGLLMVTNTLDNVSTNGWYAVNKGRLMLPARTLGVGGGVAMNWGEDTTDVEIDLVNSLRFAFGSVTTAGALTVSLLAADRAEVPAPPRGKALIGVWDCVFAGNFTTLSLHVRYDHVAAGAAPVSLLRYNASTGAWDTLASAPLSGDRLSADGLTPSGPARIGLLAVAVQKPFTGTLLMVR